MLALNLRRSFFVSGVAHHATGLKPKGTHLWQKSCPREAPTVDEFQRQSGEANAAQTMSTKRAAASGPDQQQTKACRRMTGDLSFVQLWLTGTRTTGRARHQACPLEWPLRCRSLQRRASAPIHTTRSPRLALSQAREGSLDGDGQKRNSDGCVLFQQGFLQRPRGSGHPRRSRNETRRR